MRKDQIKIFSVTLFFILFSMVQSQTNPCTKYGVLVNGTLSVSQKISVSHSLNVEYIRENIKLSTYTGTVTSYDQYLQSGFKVISNLTWDNSGTFPTTLTLYGQQISLALQNYQPEIAVIENEELNSTFHPLGTAKRYVDMLMTASPIVHAAGLKITNGGIYGTVLFMHIYRDLYTNFSVATASAFGASCLTQGQMAAAAIPNSNPSLESKMGIMDSIITGIGLYCDYANIHYYIDSLPLSGMGVTSQTVWPEVQAFMLRRINKVCITNETCIRNSDYVHFVKETLDTYKNSFTPYIVWYSADDALAGARGLQDPAGVMRPTGTEFASNILVVNSACGSVGIDQKLIGRSDILVYPNPSTDRLNIELDAIFGNEKISFFNIQNKLILEKELKKNINLIELDFPKGYYIYKITMGNQVLKRNKLIIQ